MKLVLLFLAISDVFTAQKLVVVVVDGLPGNAYYKFSHLPAFRTFEEEGVWSTKLFPSFPSFSLTNRISLMTGVPPKRHGIIADHMYNWRTKEAFHNLTQPTDYDMSWWSVDPLYVSATRSKASVAMFYFPECLIDWKPHPHLCIGPRHDGKTFSDDSEVKAVIQATKTHDLILVYHPLIEAELSHLGIKHANDKNAKEILRFQHALDRLTSQARERIDLNVIVVSTHGMVDVPRKHIRVLDEYISMDLINMTIGSGAVKQVIANTGKTHQVYSQLRHHNPIPNVKMYYTTHKVSDMPEWYQYKKSETVTDLVLIADPSYAIVTKDKTKQFPEPHLHEVPHAISGYNNQFPDIQGIFLAYGPAFRVGYKKGPLEIFDVYTLICSMMEIQCNPTPGRLQRVDDVLTSDARVAVRNSNRALTYLLTLLMSGIFFFFFR